MNRMMKTVLQAEILSLSFVLGGCVVNPSDPMDPDALGTATQAIQGGGASCTAFKAHLTGEGEVPPVDTDSTGQAELRFDANGDPPSLSTKLITPILKPFRLDTAAHLHLGPPGANGPIVASLLNPGEDDVRGAVAETTIRADNLVGPLAGLTVPDLIDAIAAGNIYVNVHTTNHPSGEIRGQVEPVGCPD